MIPLVDAKGQALDLLNARRLNYRQALLAPAGQGVLIDLARFCRANETCFHPDPRLHAVAEGRREVWLRVQQHLSLTTEELYALYGGRQFKLAEGRDE